MSIEFTKMEGCGNDYIYVDARGMNADWPALSVAMSDRHFGIGSDGLILIMDSDKAALKMRMFNADGSEGEMCGNGIRCFAKYALERGIVDAGQSQVTIDTLAGVREVTPIYQQGQVTRARVAMGLPRFSLDEIPVDLGEPAANIGIPVLQHPVRNGELTIPMSFVSMGNPHAVTFVDQPVNEYPLHIIGPEIERHAIFPRRVNYEIVNRHEDGTLRARVWERGSGETMACGTGACAIGVASRLLGYTGDRVDITLLGGTLTIEWDGAGEVFLEGPAEEVFSGEWD
jgi:diaminopimelate epimerase